MKRQNWSAWSFLRAIDLCIEQCRFMPRPNDILERYVGKPKEKPKRLERISARSESEDDEIEQLIQTTLKTERLRQQCRQFIRTDYVNRHQWQPACDQCQDTGSVAVYHPRSANLARTNQLTEAALLTCVVACHCQTGQGLAEHEATATNSNGNPRFARPIPAFDATRMLVIDYRLDTAGQVKQCQEKYQRSDANDFADWSRT